MMNESEKKLRRPRKIVEFTGVLGIDPEYEYREFYVGKNERKSLPPEWEYLYDEGGTYLLRKKRSEKVSYGEDLTPPHELSSNS